MLANMWYNGCNEEEKTENLEDRACCLVYLSIIGVVTIVYINYRKLIKNPEKLITEFKPGVDMTIDDI